MPGVEYNFQVRAGNSGIELDERGLVWRKLQDDGVQNASLLIPHSESV